MIRGMLKSFCLVSFALLICCAWPAKSNSIAGEPIKIGAVLPFSGGVELVIVRALGEIAPKPGCD